MAEFQGKTLQPRYEDSSAMRIDFKFTGDKYLKAELKADLKLPIQFPKKTNFKWMPIGLQELLIKSINH